MKPRSCPSCRSIGEPRIVDRTLGGNEPIRCQDLWHVEVREPGDPKPVFVLKGQDVLAPGIVDAYRRECVRHGLDEQAAQVELAFREMAEWQARHPERVKLPDHKHVPAPGGDVTDTPDLRTLAAEAIRHGRVRPPGELARREDQFAIADAVLAAVLPAHRRQVAEEIAWDIAGARPQLAVGPDSSVPLPGGYLLIERAAEIAGHHAATTTPPTALSARVPAEPAPAVGREAPKREGRAQCRHCGPGYRYGDEGCRHTPEGAGEQFTSDAFAPRPDEAPWVAGHLRPTEPPVHLFRRHGEHEIPIGSMLSPELAAQVVAEHRYCTEVRAMLAGAEQRLAERGPDGQADDTDALAARLGYVPAAEVEAARAGTRTALDELARTGAALNRALARVEELAEVMTRLRWLRDLWYHRPGHTENADALDEILDAATVQLDAGLQPSATPSDAKSAERTPDVEAADAVSLPPNTGPKAGDNG